MNKVQQIQKMTENDLPKHLTDKLQKLDLYVKDGYTKERAVKRTLQKFYKAYFKENQVQLTKKEFNYIIKQESESLLEYLDMIEQDMLRKKAEEKEAKEADMIGTMKEYGEIKKQEEEVDAAETVEPDEG